MIQGSILAVVLRTMLSGMLVGIRQHAASDHSDTVECSFQHGWLGGTSAVVASMLGDLFGFDVDPDDLVDLLIHCENEAADGSDAVEVCVNQILCRVAEGQAMERRRVESARWN